MTAENYFITQKGVVKVFEPFCILNKQFGTEIIKFDNVYGHFTKISPKIFPTHRDSNPNFGRSSTFLNFWLVVYDKATVKL